MQLGIDLRVLQIGHQYRGIGEHVRQLIRHFPLSPGFNEIEFVFLTYLDLEDPTTKLAGDLERYPRWRVRPVGARVAYDSSTLAGLAGRLWSDVRCAEERMLRGVDVDALLCFDFNLGVPTRARFKTVLVVYDLIPMLMRSEYLPSLRHNLGKKARMGKVVSDLYSAWRYHRGLRRAVTRAGLLLPISESTRHDIERHFKVSSDRVRTIHLGTISEKTSAGDGVELRGVTAGNTGVHVDIHGSEYLLYIGGVDPRRRVIDLVRAFELMKARGWRRLQLFLAGYDFESVASIPDAELRATLAASNHRHNIVLLGFVSANQRTALFQGARAFVYPTLYEGFGLPILEAMSNRCPVITYANSAVVETGGAAALYARGPEGIAAHVISLAEDGIYRRTVVERGTMHAVKFSWADTASQTLDALCGPLTAAWRSE